MWRVARMCASSLVYKWRRAARREQGAATFGFSPAIVEPALAALAALAPMQDIAPSVVEVELKDVRVKIGAGRRWRDRRDVEGPALMIPLPAGCRVWIATGHTDMRRGMQGLALQVQEQLKRNPHAGDLYIFRGRRGDLAKILWHDGIGLSLYAKRLDRGKFIWPSATAGAVSISAAQMA